MSSGSTFSTPAMCRAARSTPHLVHSSAICLYRAFRSPARDPCRATTERVTSLSVITSTRFPAHSAPHRCRDASTMYSSLQLAEWKGARSLSSNRSASLSLRYTAPPP